MRFKKIVASASATLAFTTAALTGCSIPSTVASEDDITGAQTQAKETVCASVPAALVEAEAAVQTAQEAVDNNQSDPTPASKQRERELEVAIAFFEALKERQNECADAAQSGDDAQSSSDKAAPEGVAGVVNPDGEQRSNVPLVNAVPGSPTPSVDTTNDPNVPASLSLAGCGIDGVEGWDQLYDCIIKSGDAGVRWIEWVESQKSNLGFGWDDIQTWAAATTPDGHSVDARAIIVFGNNISDNEARATAAKHIGDAANRLPIVRQSEAFVNTRLIDGVLQAFVEQPIMERQVRISLMPLQLDQSGHAIGLINQGSGVFVDCHNPWWMPLAVNTASGEAPPVPYKPTEPGRPIEPNKPSEPEQPASKGSIGIPVSPGSHSETPTQNPVTGSTTPDTSAPTGASNVNSSGTSCPTTPAQPGTAPSTPSTTQAPNTSSGTAVVNPSESPIVDQGGGAGGSGAASGDTPPD